MNSTIEVAWSPYPAMECLVPLKLLAVLEVSCMVPTFLINITLLYVIITSTQLSCDAQNVFPASLAAADLLISGLCQPLFLAITLRTDLFDTPFMVMAQRSCFILTSLGCAFSNTSLLLMCLQRHFQVSFPFKYERMFTRKRACIILTVMWISAAGEVMLLFTKGTDHTVFYIFVLTAISTSLVMLVVIYLRTIHIVQRLVQPAREVNNSKESLRKALKTSLISLLSFTALWFPFTVSGLVFYTENRTKAWYARSSRYDCNDRKILQAQIFLYSILLAHMNSLVNPLVYSVRNNPIKQAIRRVLRRTSDRLRRTMHHTQGVHTQGAQRTDAENSAQTKVCTIADNESTKNYLPQPGNGPI